MSEIETIAAGTATAPALPSPAALPTGMSWAQAWELAQRIARTEFVPSALRGKPESVLAAILFGRELGIGPMQALQAIHVIDGRPGASPELMRALVARAGHRIDLEAASDDAVTLRGVRADTGSSATVTWSLVDAERAGLIAIRDGKPFARSSGGKRLPWEQYPRAMLTARATSELCRILFPDVISGLSYTVEELEHIGEHPDPVPALDWGALGWTDQAEHDAQRARVRDELGQLPPDVRTELRTKWDELGLAWPLSRAQLVEWHDIVAAVVAHHDVTAPTCVDDDPAPGARPEPIDADVVDETPATPRRARTGPSMTAPAALLAELRAAGTAAELTEPEVIEVLSARFGHDIAALDALTVAQARAGIEMLTAARARVSISSEPERPAS